MTKEAPAGFRKLPLEDFGSYGPFEDLIGPLYVADLAKTSVRFGMYLEKKHTNYYCVAHGGLYVALVDAVMGNMLWRSLDEGQQVFTISITSDYMGTAKEGDWLEGDATVVRRGRTVGFTDARVRLGEKLIFSATGKFSITSAR